jgi:hypothetical protein
MRRDPPKQPDMPMQFEKRDYAGDFPLMLSRGAPHIEWCSTFLFFNTLIFCTTHAQQPCGG